MPTGRQLLRKLVDPALQNLVAHIQVIDQRTGFGDRVTKVSERHAEVGRGFVDTFRQGFVGISRVDDACVEIAEELLKTKQSLVKLGQTRSVGGSLRSKFLQTALEVLESLLNGVNGSFAVGDLGVAADGFAVRWRAGHHDDQR